MKRSTICESFLRSNGVNCCTTINNEDEGSFSRSGCDCCNGLATTTYACHGYDPKNKTVVELGDICQDCLCYFANGDDSEVEK